MGSDTPSPPAAVVPVGRLAGIGLIIFLANAALLVLQLVAGRLLAPFVGSSLETWTSVIGVFLTGIALGNAWGGKLADRYPTPRTLAAVLAVGAIAALWMVFFPFILTSSGVYKSIPLGARIPLLSFVLCLPAGFVLSLLTPLAIKLGLPNVSQTGRVAGMVFSLSTLGCLMGNYVTGFMLIPEFHIDTLVFVASSALGLLSLGAALILKDAFPGTPVSQSGEGNAPAAPVAEESPDTVNPYAFADIRLAFLIVFLASFGGMSLEITASRVLAQHLGVSLFTWTGIIGVMLAGTALGNLVGGLLADRVNRVGSQSNPRLILAGTLICAGGGAVLQFVTAALVHVYKPFDNMDPITQVMGWTFSLFFAPMFVLGMVSPQVIRLSVPDVGHVGRVAGRVYAWSTAGAIVGTFAPAYLLLSLLGMYKTILLVSLVLTLTSLLIARVWERDALLYIFSIVLGGVTGGFILTSMSGSRDAGLIAQLETNYYTIKVTEGNGNERVLTLDLLIHSSVDPDNPGYLHYRHEHIQMEFLRLARKENPNPRVLVIGGGGYTYPRYAMEMLPETRMDVVEIDPGVTRVAKEHLGLKDYEGMRIHHMDGRQFVSEKVPPGTYDLVILDAVNDLSVPAHLLTKEFDEAVKASLKPGGVYLLTVIDSIDYGKLWRAAMLTLQQSFSNVALLSADGVDVNQRQVYVIYASERPLDLDALKSAVREQVEGNWVKQVVQPFGVANLAALAAAGVQSPGSLASAITSARFAPEPAETAWPFLTHRVPQTKLQPYLDAPPRIILTDQYAPVDNLMADVFRYRYRHRVVKQD
jgi:spermidine synthase/MFS family permease